MPCMRCNKCRTRLAFLEDYISLRDIKHGIKYILQSLPGAVFKRVFNVDNVNSDRTLFGVNVEHTYCRQCRMLLGWKFIRVTPQNMCVREGRFLMNLNKISIWNAHIDGDVDEQVPNEQDLGTNEESADEDGDAIEQDLGANKKNAEQDGDANVQDPKKQDVGSNEQNGEQDEEANEQGPNKQDVGSNEQNADQDEEANEQGPNEQDLGSNDQNDDQDEDANEQVRGCCSCLM